MNSFWYVILLVQIGFALAVLENCESSLETDCQVDWICPGQEQPKACCKCKDGYFFDAETGNCYLLENCPKNKTAAAKKKCNETNNEVFSHCANCASTCQTNVNHVEKAKPGCVCKNGYIMDERTRLCISLKDSKKGCNYTEWDILLQSVATDGTTNTRNASGGTTVHLLLTKSTNINGTTTTSAGATVNLNNSTQTSAYNSTQSSDNSTESAANSTTESSSSIVGFTESPGSSEQSTDPTSEQSNKSTDAMNATNSVDNSTELSTNDKSSTKLIKTTHLMNATNIVDNSTESSTIRFTDLDKYPQSTKNVTKSDHSLGTSTNVTGTTTPENSTETTTTDNSSESTSTDDTTDASKKRNSVTPIKSDNSTGTNNLTESTISVHSTASSHNSTKFTTTDNSKESTSADDSTESTPADGSTHTTSADSSSDSASTDDSTVSTITDNSSESTTTDDSTESTSENASKGSINSTIHARKSDRNNATQISTKNWAKSVNTSNSTHTTLVNNSTKSTPGADIKSTENSSESTSTENSSESTSTDNSSESTSLNNSTESTSADDTTESTSTDDSTESTSTDDSTESTSTDESTESTSTDDSTESTSADESTESTSADDSTESTSKTGIKSSKSKTANQKVPAEANQIIPPKSQGKQATIDITKGTNSPNDKDVNKNENVVRKTTANGSTGPNILNDVEFAKKSESRSSSDNTKDFLENERQESSKPVFSLEKAKDFLLKFLPQLQDSPKEEEYSGSLSKQDLVSSEQELNSQEVASKEKDGNNKEFNSEILKEFLDYLPKLKEVVTLQTKSGEPDVNNISNNKNSGEGTSNNNQRIVLEEPTESANNRDVSERTQSLEESTRYTEIASSNLNSTDASNATESSQKFSSTNSTDSPTNQSSLDLETSTSPATIISDASVTNDSNKDTTKSNENFITMPRNHFVKFIKPNTTSSEETTTGIEDDEQISTWPPFTSPITTGGKSREDSSLSRPINHFDRFHYERPSPTELSEVGNETGASTKSLDNFGSSAASVTELSTENSEYESTRFRNYGDTTTSITKLDESATPQTTSDSQSDSTLNGTSSSSITQLGDYQKSDTQSDSTMNESSPSSTLSIIKLEDNQKTPNTQRDITLTESKISTTQTTDIFKNETSPEPALVEIRNNSNTVIEEGNYSTTKKDFPESRDHFNQVDDDSLEYMPVQPNNQEQYYEGEYLEDGDYDDDYTESGQAEAENHLITEVTDNDAEKTGNNESNDLPEEVQTEESYSPTEVIFIVEANSDSSPEIIETQTVESMNNYYSRTEEIAIEEGDSDSIASPSFLGSTKISASLNVNSPPSQNNPYEVTNIDSRTEGLFSTENYDTAETTISDIITQPQTVEPTFNFTNILETLKNTFESLPKIHEKQSTESQNVESSTEHSQSSTTETITEVNDENSTAPKNSGKISLDLPVSSERTTNIVEDSTIYRYSTDDNTVAIALDVESTTRNMNENISEIPQKSVSEDTTTIANNSRYPQVNKNTKQSTESQEENSSQSDDTTKSSESRTEEPQKPQDRENSTESEISSTGSQSSTESIKTGNSNITNNSTSNNPRFLHTNPNYRRNRTRLNGPRKRLRHFRKQDNTTNSEPKEARIPVEIVTEQIKIIRKGSPKSDASASPEPNNDLPSESVKKIENKVAQKPSEDNRKEGESSTSNTEKSVDGKPEHLSRRKRFIFGGSQPAQGDIPKLTDTGIFLNVNGEDEFIPPVRIDG